MSQERPIIIAGLNDPQSSPVFMAAYKRGRRVVLFEGLDRYIEHTWRNEQHNEQKRLGRELTPQELEDLADEVNRQALNYIRRKLSHAHRVRQRANEEKVV